LYQFVVKNLKNTKFLHDRVILIKEKLFWNNGVIMKKTIIMLTILMLISIGILSGCIGDKEGSENNPKVMNLGDSVTYGDTKITFLSAAWETVTMTSTYHMYVLRVAGENMGSANESFYVTITKYEMANGYTYSESRWSYFNLKPGAYKTDIIQSRHDLIDRDFLPVSKIYITIDTVSGRNMPHENPVYIILNV
jgi:hypothetical protein